MPAAGLLVDHQEGSATPHGDVDHLKRRDQKAVDVVGLRAADPGPDYVPVCRLGDNLAPGAPAPAFCGLSFSWRPQGEAVQRP